MKTETIFPIVLILIIAYFCYCLWKAGRYREPDNKIYEKELRNKCPFDGNHCGVIGKSLVKGYVTKTCLKCPRYDNWKRNQK